MKFLLDHDVPDDLSYLPGNSATKSRCCVRHFRAILRTRPFSGLQHEAGQSRGKLIDEMPQETKSTETAASRARLARGFVLLPPVGMDDLKKDTEHDPEGAEEFVA